MTDVIVIGGGPAGLFAAYHAALNGNSVLVLEKNDRCGKKLNITGKGRCNLTNHCPREEFLQNVIANPMFLMSAISKFSTRDTMDFFEALGVPLKVERGNRVFPESDRAQDITDALVNAVECMGVEICKGKRVSALITQEGKIKGVRCGKEEFFANSVIIACGGASYPRTGSDGSGHKLAQSVGHRITKIRPSLVPLVSKDKICAEAMGLSLKNVGVSFYKDGKRIYYEQGEMMFTHFGVTGPVVLSASSHLGEGFPYEMLIDLKPALDEKTLDKRLLRDFTENCNKELKNGFSALLPSKLIEPFIRLTGIAPETRLNSLTREQRGKILALLKSLPVKIIGTRPIDEAIVTGGGVDCKEIDPKTMESKLVSGLYFAGEVMDLDAYTGGFNLQIAFSTGFAAGSSQ